MQLVFELPFDTEKRAAIPAIAVRSIETAEHSVEYEPYATAGNETRVVKVFATGPYFRERQFFGELALTTPNRFTSNSSFRTHVQISRITYEPNEQQLAEEFVISPALPHNSWVAWNKLNLRKLQYNVPNLGRVVTILVGSKDDFDCFTSLPIPMRTTFHCVALDQLKPGSPLTWRFPLQTGNSLVSRLSRTQIENLLRGGHETTWPCQVLTDGTLEIPYERPGDRNWDGLGSDIRSLRVFKNKDWPAVIRALKGCFVSEVLPAGTIEIGTGLIRERMRRLAAVSEPSKSKVDPSSMGRCLKGAPGTSVKIGANFVFTLIRKAGLSPLFAVDSPNVCALYVFSSEADATAWAARQISFEDARRRALLLIVHSLNWEAKARTELLHLGVQEV